MVYAKTFTTFARHAFQKAAFAGHAHASPSGAGHASSFFNQSFAGASRSNLGHGAIANRFQTQFGAHAGKNNPSQGGSQTLYGQGQNSLAASTTNDDSKEQEAFVRPSSLITRHLKNPIFTPLTDAATSTPSQARPYSTSASQPLLTGDTTLSEPNESETNLTPGPNLPPSSPDYALPTLESYEKEVSTLMERGDFGSVVSVYHDMKRLGFVPTARIYNHIIVSLSRIRAREPVYEIIEIYTEMLDKQIEPESTTVSTVIHALCERSTEVANLIEETNLRIERDTTGAFKDEEKVKLLTQEENIKTALNLFNASLTTVYPPHSIETFNTMLEALSKHGMAPEVLHVYEQMENLGIQPNVHTFAHLITAFGKHGDMRSAIECYNEYKSQASLLPAHDENLIYEVLIASYFASGDAGGGIQFLKKVRSVPGKYLSRKILDAVVAGLCQRGDLEGALKWVHEMKSTSTLPNPSVSSIRPIVHAASRVGNLAIAKEAFDLAAEGRAGTGHEWKAELQLFISLCLREGELPTAVLVMDEFILQRIMPDSDIGIAFLEKLVVSSGVDRATEYFERFAKLAEASPAVVAEFDTIVSGFVGGFDSLEPAVASRLISILQALPTVLSKGPTKASRILVTAFKDLKDNTYVDGATLSGLIKYQSALTGWDASQNDDANYLISMLCAICPEDWIYLQPARQVINDQLLRIRDQDILRLWREITDGIDLTDNRGNSPTSLLHDSIPSNHSHDDDVSVGTLDTAPTSSDSAISPYLSTPRPLPTQYHYFTPRAPDFNIHQSRRLIKSLPKALKDPSTLNSLLDTLRYIRRKGERLLPEALGRLISVAGKAHRVDIVSETFEFAQSTVREVIPEHEIAFSEWCLILNSMIVANAFNHNFADARHFHSELLKLGVAPDSDAFAAYIINLNVTDTNDEATEALSLFHEAKSLGVRPSTFLYNTLISKLAKARRSDDALYYFHEMKVNGVTPSSVTYGTVINACCRVGNEALAVRYFNEMEADQHFVPRIAPYNTMLQFYVQTKQDRADALRFYEKMRAQLLTPSPHTYKLLMDAYATLNPIDIQAAENILNLIKNDRQRPFSTHYASLIHAYGCVKQDLDSAKAWFYKAIDRSQSSPGWVKPDEIIYQALIEAYVANHRVGDCSTIFKHMEENNIKLTVYMANHLIHGWTIAGNLQEARRIFDSLATEKTGLYGREPSSYEQMTRTYLAMGDRNGALALVEEMKTRGYPAAVVARVTDILEGGNSVGGLLYNRSNEEMGSSIPV